MTPAPASVCSSLRRDSEVRSSMVDPPAWNKPFRLLLAPSCHSNPGGRRWRRAVSADEVERIGHLEGAAAMPAIDVAHLVADIGDDGVALALGLDLDALLGLVVLHRSFVPV